jgi:AcrR family transcriptional regulator
MSNPHSTDSITQPRWQRRPEARPEEILEAAQKVFGESGFARAKLDDVARLAGVSKGTLYLYFDSKETLFREVVRAKIIALLAESEVLVQAHSGSCRELLVQLITGMFHSMRDHEIVKISRVAQAEFASFPELAQFYFHEVIVRARRLVAQVLQRGVEAGEFRSIPHGFAARKTASRRTACRST